MNTQQTTIQTVIDVAREIDDNRFDYMASTSNLEVSRSGLLRLADNGNRPFTGVNGQFDATGPAPMHLTPYALGQLANRLSIKYGRAFFTNNRDLPPHIESDVLNHYMALREEKDLLIRQFDDEIHGVCSDRYLIMDHAWMLETAAQFLTDKDDDGNPIPGQYLPHIVVPGWRVTADKMDVKIIMRAENNIPGSDSGYGMGVAIRNGTVANGSASVDSLAMRTSCTNSLRFRNREWSIRHLITREPIAAREASIIAAMSEGFKTGYELANSLIRARNQRLPNLNEVVGEIVRKQNLPQELEPIINMGTEGQFTLAGLANGLTFAAQATNNSGVLNSDEDAAGDLEAFAGSLLFNTADGTTSGDDLARSLFALAGTRAHVAAEIEE